MLSTRDFKRALKLLWGKSGLSRSSVSRANKALKEAFDNWCRRDLSLEEIIYLFLDGIYLGVRGNSRNKEAVLVALSDPDHEEHDAMLEWTGGKFDPNAFFAVEAEIVSIKEKYKD